MLRRRKISMCINGTDSRERRVWEKVVGMGPGDSSKSDRRVWKSVCSVQSRGPGWNRRREGAWFGIL